MTIRPLNDLIAALRRRTPVTGRTRVLAVDGPSGSGKTSLAARLANAADRTGTPIPVVHLDDIYPGWDGLADAPGLLVDGVLRPLRDRGPAAYHRWDWERGEWAERHDVPATDALIVEGVGSGALACAPFLTMLAWVDAPRDVRMARGIDRDGETYRPHWERWAVQEVAMFAADGTRERADLRIDGDPSEPHSRDREVVLID
ncbi:nucleoside/nucleotide kinase family protein [Solicola gregarius]|uniref:4-amino-4-deoxy-L-arabinose transferase n=1 Tax=Solicola gregarius TaxID=2908642 RepID=A0AA46TFA7_9ACTN|nr:4-amino-4-deoxy-L-arabinose transferase [Solicola gregarius]UYM04284.1 4-amino-4-deoxy-L-arabinose transferase [Solicola gregarius]